MNRKINYSRPVHNLFTLVELLICIAIIAILASILLPVLGKVKEKSRQLTCKNNLKQILISTYSYSADFDGYAPAPMLNNYYDIYNIGTLLELRWAGALYVCKYLPNVYPVACCPTDFDASYGIKENLEDKPFHAATVTFGMMNISDEWYRLSTEKEPSKRILFVDSLYFREYNSYNKWCHSNYLDNMAKNPPSAPKRRTVHLRHPGATGNAVFSDGHAASLNAAGFKEYGVGGGRSKHYLPLSF